MLALSGYQPALLARAGPSRAHAAGLAAMRPQRITLRTCRPLCKPSKVYGGGRDGAGAPPSYSEALMQREYELWQRQSELYERLQDQHAADLERFATERATWQATEAALRAEAAELRAQLMYVINELGAAHAVFKGGPVVGGAAPTAFSAASQQAAIAGRAPAGALPAFDGPGESAASTQVASSGPSPAEQVKAVVDAMRAGVGPASPATPAPAGSSPRSPSSSSSSVVSPSEAWPAGGGGELPTYAADLAAAVAAALSGDVLSGIPGYAPGGRRDAAAEPAPPQPAAAAAAPPPPQRQAPAAPAPEEKLGESAGSGQDSAAELAARGPPPMMTLGGDDLFWVNQLHTALVDLGYYPGDEDIADFYFGEGTQSAVMTMQACEGLAETGIADEATWARLLGPALSLKESRDLTADMMVNIPGVTSLGGKAAAAGTSSSDAQQQQQQQGEQREGKPYAELFTAAFSKTVTPLLGGGVKDEQRLAVTDTVAVGDKVVSKVVSERVEVAKGPTYTEWPILHEGDGGREVHAMHAALMRAGYYPGEDDERWWSFGDGTMTALKTFQVCNGYPESGVCDVATWRLLLGQDADPSEIAHLNTGDSADEDLSDQTTDRVWLIGEQRWEDRSRVRRS